MKNPKEIFGQPNNKISQKGSLNPQKFILRSGGWSLQWRWRWVWVLLKTLREGPSCLSAVWRVASTPGAPCFVDASTRLCLCHLFSERAHLPLLQGQSRPALPHLILVTPAKNLFPNVVHSQVVAGGGAVRTWAYLLGGHNSPETVGTPRNKARRGDNVGRQESARGTWAITQTPW